MLHPAAIQPPVWTGVEASTRRRGGDWAFDARKRVTQRALIPRCRGLQSHAALRRAQVCRRGHVGPGAVLQVEAITQTHARQSLGRPYQAPGTLERQDAVTESCRAPRRSADGLDVPVWRACETIPEREVSLPAPTLFMKTPPSGLRGKSRKVEPASPRCPRVAEQCRTRWSRL